MFFKVVEVVGYYLPGIGSQARLLEELSVELVIGLKFLYLSQQGTVVTIGIPEEDGVVVQHIGLGIAV